MSTASAQPDEKTPGTPAPPPAPGVPGVPQTTADALAKLSRRVSSLEGRGASSLAWVLVAAVSAAALVAAIPSAIRWGLSWWRSRSRGLP